MSSKRPAILMAVLLLALGGYFAQQYFDSAAPRNGASAWVMQPPLPGKNAISNLQVHQDVLGAWKADFDYFFTGDPVYGFAFVELAPLVNAAETLSPEGARIWTGQESTLLKRGSHHISVTLNWPGAPQTTRSVTVKLRDPKQQVIATQQVLQSIEWPTYEAYAMRRQMSSNTPEQNLLQAQQLIDSENTDALLQAKTILESLLRQDARFVGAYRELARVAMKSDGAGPDGLHQAESFLNSALAVSPDNADTQILMGYVYTHQHRYAEGEKLYAQAAAQNPPNPWLWSNWGEQLTLQHKPDEAIARYRQALAQPKRSDSYDRGRQFAYHQLLTLLGQKKDFDAMEVVYKQQVADYGPGSCYSTDYARFLLQIRGDTQGAIDLSKRALNQDCNDAPAREVLGLAQYVKWAGTSGPEREAALNEARIYLPPGPSALFQLAANDRTVTAAKQLIAAGEPIDRKDNLGRTALAIALEEGDLGAARRLLTLHARGDALVGSEDVPLALIPVMEQNLPAIRLLREFGVNYSKLTYRGHTAIEFAKQSQNPELLQALGGGGTSL